ncbi:GNAT family N-acetyltransferase [Methylobacterium durans]|uniref:N-acetyltransferase n=1 Tax=Methylobacterium durans TaxID=2202825 RepID=A0A2U8W2H9_9HYPH|nr:GNAT family N-acetyltransferase [Methylobacterium durans]AWN40304.1 N-acetyltransferase [Methylobacterium durans]
MTLRARFDAFAGMALDGWTGTSRHWPTGGDAIAVESIPSDPHAARLRAVRGGEIVAEAQIHTVADGEEAMLALTGPEGRHPADTPLVACLIEAAFQRCPDARRLRVAGLGGAPALVALAADGRASPGSAAPDALVERSGFYQLPLLWLRPETRAAHPQIRSAFGPEDRLPPLRPPQPNGVMYRRWLPHLGTTLSFRAIDRRVDLVLFHQWMNQPRVSYYWELARSETELDRYLADQEADPHLFGVIGSFNDVPVGYFEFYWAKEDRLGPYYDAEDHDRGWHGLIGNPDHLGRPKTLAWFKAVTHYLFLDEPRTRRIMGEPRASHRKMLSYCADAAYETIKEFDFPHKRAALVCCERERFFREVPL